jgi:hypothetical protein
MQHYYNSVPTMSDCAIGPDGKLLDAKDIQWYKDIDSLVLINQTATNLDDEGSTDSNESDDYEPDIAEHLATNSDGEGGDTKPDEDFDLAYDEDLPELIDP